MDVGEAVQRIFRVRGLVVVALVCIGAFAGIAVHYGLESKTYTASVRLVLGGPVPQSTGEAAADAGTVEGIVTSPDRVNGALTTVKATRDLVQFTRKITTTSLSDSGVLQLSVTDPDPQIATSVANILANSAVTTLNSQQHQPIEVLLGQLQSQIDYLTTEIQSLDNQLSAAGNNTLLETALVSQRSDVSNQMSSLIAKKADLQAQLAQGPQAAVISQATTPTKTDPSRLPLDLILGTIAGLILGVAIAGITETVRPTLVGAAAIERGLGAPVLAVVDSQREMGENELLALSARIRRAAERSHATTALLWSLNGSGDLEELAQQLQAAKPAVIGTAGRPSFSVRAAAQDERFKARAGVVVVVTPRLPARKVEEAETLRAARGVTFLGVIIVPSPRRRMFSRQPQPRVAVFGAPLDERSQDGSAEHATAVMAS